MSRSTTCLMFVSLFMSSLVAGCLTSDDISVSPISLVVYYDSTSGTLYENWTNGQQISQTGVELNFDFARTTSSKGELQSFSFSPGDGSAEIEVLASDSASITYEYQTHGLFLGKLSATDESENRAEMDITIRIDSFVHWIEQNSDDPQTMSINTIPDCEQCEGPTLISIDSQVSNPESVFPPTGSTTTITWKLNDPEDNTTASKTEPVADGQTKLWEHDQLGVTPGMWSLDVIIDNGEDNINIEHNVSIRYEEKETEPNPIDVPESSSL
jgi:hypothetical protein